ncbi:MAG: phage major tail tube protein, partial [Aminivibrio sp.]
MANVVPEKNINFSVYLEGGDLLGVAEVTLPPFEAMTETVKGAGIAGEFESVVLGHFGSMVVTLNWRNVTDSAIKLLAPRAHNLDLYGALQDY